MLLRRNHSFRTCSLGIAGTPYGNQNDNTRELHEHTGLSFIRLPIQGKKYLQRCFREGIRKFLSASTYIWLLTSTRITWNII
jgi:hypothetical protein